MRPATISFREIDRNPGHVRVQVWIGRNPDARGNSGTLTIRTDEWDELSDERHLIQFDDDGWTIQHPLVERLDGSLFDCERAQWRGDDPGVRGRFELLDCLTIGDPA